MTEPNDQESVKIVETEEISKEASEVAQVPDNNAVPLDPDIQKTLYLSNLLHPGGWRMHPDIINFLSSSESFQIGFNSQPGKEKKVGNIKLKFARPYDAREAYLQALKVRIGGERIKVTVDNGFCDPADISPCPWFEIPEDDELRSRTVYALDLLKSTRANSLKEFFEQDQIETISMLPLNTMQKQAEVRLVSAEAASAAIETLVDCELDDGNSFSIMRLLNHSDYKAYADVCRAPQPFVPPPEEPEEVMEDGEIKSNKRKHEEIQKPVEEAPQPAPEVYEDDLIIQFDKYINENRINWAEIDEVHELFTICDHVSRVFNGLPDSILKPAMLSTLNRQLAIVAGSGSYLTQHLNDLIEKWKREMMKTETTSRDGQVVMEAPGYDPAPLPKRRREKNTRAGTIKMSVGALLKSVRDSIKTEDGELDFAEDEFGNYTIAGEELSFESYARLTKTNEPEIKSMFPTPLNHAMKMAQIPKKIRKEWYEKRMAKKKLHLMQKEQENMRKLEENAEIAPPKPPKELDEGEIDSDEEKQVQKSEKKKKKRSSDSSSSSSSSSSDSDGDGSAVDARGRRRERRKKERRTGANAMDHRRVMQLYHNRMAICSLLSSDQKLLLVNVLKEESLASR